VSALRIRRARPEDGESIAAMCAALARHQGDGPCEFTPARFRADGFGPARRFDCLIAEQEGAERDRAPVGYALFYPEYNTDVMQRSAYLVDLYVEPAARRGGVGRALLAASARAAAAEGATMLSWSVKRANDGARAFYRAFASEQPELFYGVASGERLDRLASIEPSAAVALRTAERHDVPVIARFIAELLLATDGKPPADIEGPLARHGFAGDPAFAAILAEDREGPLGHALFWRAYDTEHAERGAFLSDLYVVPRARRRGVGLALLGGFARWTKATGGSYGFWQILETNAPAIAFYAPIAVEDRTVLPCMLEGERFRALAAEALGSESDG
jgi:diamine N-acetyltransferase